MQLQTRICRGRKRGNHAGNKLRDEYIKLGQALKAAGVVDSGVTAKLVILDEKVKVNGEVEVQRGKKLYDGDVVEALGETIKIVK